MVDKLEAGKTYRCIDLEGYYREDSDNIAYWKEYSVDGNYTLDKLSIVGEGVVGDTVVIGRYELKYFELVEDEVFWDGKEPLEIGMIVGWMERGGEFELVLKQTNNNMKTFVVLKDCDGDIYTVYINLLTSLLPDLREEFSKEVLAEIRGTHPDYAQDTTWDIKDLAKLCYDKLKGGDNA